MPRLVTRYPFTTYGIVGLGFWAVTWLGKFQYDDSGFKGALFWIGEVFRVPYWIVDELIFSLSGGKNIFGQVSISIVLGLCFCVGLDLILRRIRRK